MLLDLKNQYYQNDYTTQGNLQTQCKFYQITNDILHRTRTKCFKIYMETQKSPKSQSNIEKKNRTGGTRLLGFRVYYKATIIKMAWYRHKNRNRSMEQDKKARNKPKHLRSTNLRQRRQEHRVEER